MVALHKLLTIRVTDDVLAEMDDFLETEGGVRGRNQFISEALHFYLKEKNRQRIKERLAEGYREMAEINLNICQEYFLCEQEVMK